MQKLVGRKDSRLVKEDFAFKIIQEIHMILDGWVCIHYPNYHEGILIIIQSSYIT
jgi:hypothetical protein